jgi:LysM repeat protein
MLGHIKTFILIFAVLLTVLSNSTVWAQPVHMPLYEGSPYDLINAVNALRAAYGLPAYNISSILMSTAQSQADFMAATGNVTHSGLGGISFTDRLLAAGYPLAGDLSAGGFRAENITSGNENMPASAAIDGWMGDAPHQNTMLSPNLTEIGAGVAVLNGRVYYVIDCALPTTSSVPQAGTQIVGSGSAIPTVEAAVIYPVVLSTPNSAGDVIHEVQSGQTLWQIAISYEVKIDDIKRLNNLFDNSIYPGNKLLIKKDADVTAFPPTESATPELTATPISLVTSIPTLIQTMTQIPLSLVSSATPQNNNRVLISVIAIIALALLGGALFTWLGSSRDDNPG